MAWQKARVATQEQSPWISALLAELALDEQGSAGFGLEQHGCVSVLPAANETRTETERRQIRCPMRAGTYFADRSAMIPPACCCLLLSFTAAAAAAQEDGETLAQM